MNYSMTYYVVAQKMGLNKLDFIYSAIDYMLGTIFLGYCLLFIIYNWYLCKIDGKEYINLYSNINSENNNKSVININTNIQSAENWKGFSETIRQLFNFIAHSRIDRVFYKKIEKNMEYNIFKEHFSTHNKENNINDKNYLKDSQKNFWGWFAGIIDGDGNFDLRKINGRIVFKSIRIKLHSRDVRILKRIQNHLHFGKIKVVNKTSYSMYIISTQKEKEYIINNINGLIRIKVESFKKACDTLNINMKEPNYVLEPYDSYFSGLIDTDGSIVFNYPGNRIECNLEIKINEHSEKLNLNKVIPGYQPAILYRKKSSSAGAPKIFSSIAFKFQNVKGMILLYDYFLKNRLYSDFKFYRITKIKEFIEIRDFKKSPKDSPEFKIYSNFLLDWIQYRNPLWNKVPFVDKIR